jgi:hypothetical protein
MEKFAKVLSRQQTMMNHALWRRELAEYFTLRFGYQRAIRLTGIDKIGFDVQPEPDQAKQIIRQFKNTGQMPVFVNISLS